MIAYALAVFMYGVLMVRAWRSVVQARMSEVPPGVWLFASVLAWPMSMAMTGLSQTSMRYYLPYGLLCLAAWAYEAAEAPFQAARTRLTFALVAMVGVAACWWLPLTRSEQPPPQRFLIGNMFEVTHHFLPLDDVARHAAEARRCRFRDSYFIAAPLHFFHAIEAWPCERQAQWRVEYCQDCIEPPYVKTQDLEPR